MNSILNATLPDFWSLWIKHQDYLYSACLKWMSNIPDAEDIMSQAMLKAEEKMRIYAVNNFRNWVTKLTYNLCLDFQRKRYQTIQYGDIQNVTSNSGNSVDKHEETLFLDLQQQELEEVFSVWIDELRPILRDTFILHFKEQLSYIEIAQKLNISCCNVRRRIYQARQILRQRYDQDYIGEDQNKSEFVPEIDRNKESDQITKIGL
jgi:RNA polymerase sigma-70 factor (ECF subfamily)